MDMISYQTLFCSLLLFFNIQQILQAASSPVTVAVNDFGRLSPVMFGDYSSTSLKDSVKSVENADLILESSRNSSSPKRISKSATSYKQPRTPSSKFTNSSQDSLGATFVYSPGSKQLQKKIGLSRSARLQERKDLLKPLMVDSEKKPEKDLVKSSSVQDAQFAMMRSRQLSDNFSTPKSLGLSDVLSDGKLVDRINPMPESKSTIEATKISAEPVLVNSDHVVSSPYINTSNMHKIKSPVRGQGQGQVAAQRLQKPVSSEASPALNSAEIVDTYGNLNSQLFAQENPYQKSLDFSESVKTKPSVVVKSEPVIQVTRPVNFKVMSPVQQLMFARGNNFPSGEVVVAPSDLIKVDAHSDIKSQQLERVARQQTQAALNKVQAGQARMYAPKYK